ncbi:MAG: hypothetical protein ACYC4L_01835 [Chloroflexota bacterium]
MDRRAKDELATLASELEELLAERHIELGRPMRGAERDRLRHSFERAEERLRARIAVLAGGDDGGAGPSDGKES